MLGHKTVGKRPTLAVVIVSLFILTQAFLYLFFGVGLLVAQELFEGASLPQLAVAGSLTDVGAAVVIGVFLTLFGVIALAVFIGFLLRQRWAWVWAITWVTVSLVIGLVAYFEGQAAYLTMALDVVLVISLNHTTIQKEFREEGPIGS